MYICQLNCMGNWLHLSADTFIYTHLTVDVFQTLVQLIWVFKKKVLIDWLIDWFLKKWMNVYLKVQWVRKPWQSVKGPSLRNFQLKSFILMVSLWYGRWGGTVCLWACFIFRLLFSSSKQGLKVWWSSSSFLCRRSEMFSCKTHICD